MFFLLSLLFQIVLFWMALNFLIGLFRDFRTRQDDFRTRRNDNREWDTEWTYRSYRTYEYGGNPYREPSVAPALASAYRTLGVSPDSTDTEIKSAFRNLALQFHPDRYATSDMETKHRAEEHFKKINEAYQLIKQKRGLD